jgi:dipeptidyl aminopeptidase/acylaminoacyl peptidase
MSEILFHDSVSYFSPVPSADGRFLAVQSRDMNDLGYSQTQVEVLTLSTGEVNDLTSSRLDRSTSGVTWSADSRHLYFTANSNGGTPLFRVNVMDGQIERLTDFDKGVRSFDVTGASLSYVLTQVSNPFELYVTGISTARRTSGQLTSTRVLTDLNARWLRDKKLSYPVQATLNNDGFEVEYWIMKPTNFEEGNRYPLVLQIHGGPSAMWGPGEASMWHEFQYFAARGYGIVYSNPRGSGGYGRDFQAGNYQDWGHGPASDVLAATDAAMSMDWVDSEKLVTTGGSYAGYLVAWIVAHDHRFKAAFAQRGVYDLKTFLGEGNAWRLVPNHFGGFPWEPGIDSVLTANSPLTFVDQIQTPLLIKHGDVDLRTGVIQSEMLYKSLKILEKPVEYVRYPRASHEMSRSGEVQQRMDRILRIYEYFERHIN